MATVKNYGLKGVGSEVQFGKGGVHFVNEGDEFKAYANTAATGAPDTSTLVNVHGAEPTVLTHLTTKNYVDNVAAGLDPKESCRVATNANIDLGTGGLLTIDGVTLNDGDRVLVRAQGTTTENGVYVAAAGAWSRSADMDGTPANEVASGMFTFVEEGDVYANTGWVTLGLGILSVGTDPIEWAQFSGSGATTLTGGTGITVTQAGINWTVDANTSGVSTGISGGDNIIVRSTGTTGQVLRSTGVDGAEAAWGALDLASDDAVTGLLDLNHGGTNADMSAFAADSLLVMNDAGTAYEALNIGTANQVLTVNAAGDGLEYALIDLAGANINVTGVLEVTNGGTGAATLTDGGIMIGAGTSAVEFVAPIADTTQYLRANGAGANPIYDWVSQLHDDADGSLVLNATGDGTDWFVMDADTAGTVKLLAAGGSTNVGMEITPKGTGLVNIDGLTYPKEADVTDDAEGAFLNLSADGGTVLELSFPTWVTDDLNSGFAAWDGSPSAFYTVSGTGGNFTVDASGYGYIQSRKVTWAASQSASLTQNATNFIYVDSTGTVQSTTAPSQDLYEDNIVLFQALDDGTNVLVVRENHPYNFDTQVSAYNHRVIGTIISGIQEQIGADVSIDDNTAGATSLTVSGGGFVEDHGIRDAISSGTVDWNVYYTDGGGNWVRQGAARQHLGAYYNNSGTPTLTADFAAFGLYVSKTDLEGGTKFFAVMHNADFANVGAAQTAINDGTLQTPTNELFDVELTRLAYVIMDGEGNTSDNDTIESVTISKEVLGSQIVSGGGGGTAASISTNTANFDNILSASDSTVQLALETLDDHLLDDHREVSITSKATDDILQWNGASWVNVQPEAFGVNSWSTITTDVSGPAVADAGNDTIAFTGGEGIRTTGADGSPESVTWELVLSQITDTPTPEGTDEVVFVDATDGSNAKTTFLSMIQNLDLVTTGSLNTGGATGNGMLAKAADDTTVARTLTASVVAGDEGISIVNGDGVSGNPTIGLDLTGLASTSVVAGTEEVMIFDGTNNVKVSVSDLLATTALDRSRIGDGANAAADTTYVDTNENAEVVDVFADSDQVAKFQNTGGTADSHFVFEVGTAGEIRLEADGSGSDVDIRLVPKGNGQVFIGDTGAGVIQADDDNSLTVKGGDQGTTGGGDLLLEGGDGATSNGNVYVQPGSGAGTDGQVCVRDGDENLITCFIGGSGTPDSSLTVTNGTGEVVIGSAGDSNADIVLDPAGTGQVVLESGYTPTAGNSLVDKDYVDNQIATTTDELVLRATLTQAGGTIGVMSNVASKSYFVDRIVVTVSSVTGTWTAGGDITSTGAGTYATGASDIDYSVAGTYIIDAELNTSDEGGVTFNMGALTGVSAATVKIAVHYKATSSAL